MLRSFTTLIAVSTAVLAAEPSPRERVLALVPPDASVCFVVQNLRANAKAVGDSEFAKWASTKLAVTLDANADAQKIKQVEGFITAILGVSLAELRDDIFGDCLAFAYESAKPGQPDSERGIMILHARDPKKLQTLIGKLNQFQKASGELKVLNERTHQGRTYIQRDRGPGVSEYYLVDGNLFAFAMHEEAIKTLIERIGKSADSTVLNDLDELKLQNAFWACWLSPRKLDADLAAPAGASAAEAAGRAQMAKLWSAVDRCAIYLAADSDLELGLSVTYRAVALPAEVKAQFDAPPKASPLWGSIPADALVAMAGQAEADALLNAMAAFLPDAERAPWRKHIEKELGLLVGPQKLAGVMAQAGPEFGIWAVKSHAESAVPAVTAALKIRNAPDAAIPDVVNRSLAFTVRMHALDYNRKHNDTVTFEESSGLSRLSGDVFPRGVAPAFAMKESYLVIGSSADAVSKFTAPKPLAPRADVPLLRVSAVTLREQIASHRDVLAGLIAKVNGRDTATVAKDLDSLAMVLEVVQSAEVILRGDSRSRTFAVKLKPIKPLK